MKKVFLLLACLSLSSIQAQNPEYSKQDREFAEYALKSNFMEMKYAELASRKGYSPEVKELAAHMTEDHKKSDALLKQITANRALTVPTQLDADEQKNFDKLSDKEGEEFDRAFTDCMASDHKKSIDAYEKETKKGENTELRAYATNTLPGINKHKNLADEACKKLKKK